LPPHHDPIPPKTQGQPNHSVTKITSPFSTASVNLRQIARDADWPEWVRLLKRLPVVASALTCGIPGRRRSASGPSLPFCAHSSRSGNIGCFSEADVRSARASPTCANTGRSCMRSGVTEFGRKRLDRFRPSASKGRTQRALSFAWPMMAGKGEGHGTLRV